MPVSQPIGIKTIKLQQDLVYAAGVDLFEYDVLSALGYWQSKLVSEGKYSSLYDEYIQKEHGCEVGGGQTARSKPSKDSSISHPPSAPAPTPYLQPPTAKYDAFDNHRQ